MRILSHTTIVFKSPTEEQIFVKISNAINILPCLKCGETSEAVLILVGLDNPTPDEEYSTIIYPCGYVLGKDTCFKDQSKKSFLQHDFEDRGE